MMKPKRNWVKGTRKENKQFGKIWMMKLKGSCVKLPRKQWQQFVKKP